MDAQRSTRPLTRRHFMLLFGTGLGGLVASACQTAPTAPTTAGGPSTKAPAPSSTQAPQAAPAATAASPTTAQPAAPTRGGELRIALAQANQTMDPHYLESLVDRIASDAVYESLLDYDETGKIIPGLAESWEVGGDGKTITMRLRQGVKFHDGTAFDAAAVKWNFDRILNPDEKTLRRSDLDALTSAAVVDSTTVKLTLLRADVTVLANLTSVPGVYMVSPSAVQQMGKEKFAQNPVGTGPFKFAEWQRGTKMSFTRNDSYWKPNQPYVDRVTFSTIPDSTVMTLNLTSGNVDIIPTIAPKDVSTLKSNKDVRIVEGTGGVWFIWLNMRRPPFDKLANRQAFMHAIDYAAIYNVAYFGMGKRGSGSPFPPESFAFDPSLPPLERDLTKAKQKLAEAGNPNGFSFRVAFAAIYESPQVMQMVQASLAEVGIRMELMQTEASRLNEILLKDRDGAEAWQSGILASRLEPAGYVDFNLVTDSRANFSGWSNAQFDGFLREAVQTFDRDKRQKIYQDAAKLVTQDVPGVYYMFPPRLQATRANVQNYRLDALGKVGFRECWLQKT